MIEWLTGSLVYNLFKDAFGYFFRVFQPRPSEEKIALRQKWKPIFEDHILDQFSNDLRSDVVVRDVKRVDAYPELEEKAKGISPWFRVGLVGTYHRGIYVAFEWNRLVDVGGGEYRFFDYEKDDLETKENAKKVVLLGLIPFEYIEDVDFAGDEYYGYPHIYCHFSNKGEPYERVAFFTQNQLFPDSLPYHTEIADPNEVKATSKKLGVSNASLL